MTDRTIQAPLAHRVRAAHRRPRPYRARLITSTPSGLGQALAIELAKADESGLIVGGDAARALCFSA